jgi:hypothetical protein
VLKAPVVLLLSALGLQALVHLDQFFYELANLPEDLLEVS